MDADRLELLRSLFVAATEVIEDAHDTAILGQSPRLRRPGLIRAAEKLRAAGDDLTNLAETIKIFARQT